MRGGGGGGAAGPRWGKAGGGTAALGLLPVEGGGTALAEGGAGVLENGSRFVSDFTASTPPCLSMKS